MKDDQARKAFGNVFLGCPSGNYGSTIGAQSDELAVSAARG